MRRGNFMIIALVALGTYFTLSALVGRRGGLWEGKWRTGHCQQLPSSSGSRPAAIDSMNIH